jgi:hypothetical protein
MAVRPNQSVSIPEPARHRLSTFVQRPVTKVADEGESAQPSSTAAANSAPIAR